MPVRVIRVALLSQDAKLKPLLAPAMGRDFLVVPEPNRERLKQLVWDGAFDVVLLDMDSESCDLDQQTRFFDEISASEAAIVVLSDDGARPLAIELVQRGAHSQCRKPPALRELKTLVRRAAEHASMKRELERRQGSPAAEAASDSALKCDGLIGSSPEMREVYDLVRRVANLNASILITGETGTGKELIARAIHNLGDRGKAPFVPVSCGAIPETLIESELFGHERGAFTGTAGSRTGLFEQAGNGTLFLDEIGELSLQIQVKLLRVLQQKEFTRLGSGRPIPLKARLIFATHRDLSRMIAESTFRLDLFHRINVMAIRAPSLAEHPEDIPELAHFFVKLYAEEYNKYMTGIAQDVLGLFQGYEWPGNVRELENVIQSAIIRADLPVIQVQDLPDRFRHAEPAGSDLPQNGTFEALLRDFKLKVALKAIEECNGNKTLAARSLNISRAYLHRLIRPGETVESIDAA